MDLNKIIEELNLEIVAGYNEEMVEVQGVYICDLLSLVMSKAKSKDIWITIQSHVNIIAVATLVELSCIIVAEGMDIDKDTIKKANEVKVPLLKSKLDAYTLASQLNKLGI
ncbi:DRTGG domain-containing protein [Dethiothermospora halolimnae]|uniref:DRTGG domain-containing protein n=1 Tax=Dethiothermospora halolimnae TaxID=3114390 RepID=UPI003CCBA3A9